MRDHIRTAAMVLMSLAAPAIADEPLERYGDTDRNEMPGVTVSRPLTNKPNITAARYSEPGAPTATVPSSLPMTLPEMIGPGTLAARQMIGTAPVMSGHGTPIYTTSSQGCPVGSPGCATPHAGILARLSHWMFYIPGPSAGYAPCEIYSYTVPAYAYFPCRPSPRWVKGMYAGVANPDCRTGSCVTGGNLPANPNAPPSPYPYPTPAPAGVPAPMSPNFTDAKGVPMPKSLPVTPTSAPKVVPPSFLPPAIPSASNTKGATVAPAGYRTVGGSGPVYQQTPVLSPAYYRLMPVSVEPVARPTSMADAGYRSGSTTGGTSKPTPSDR